MFSAKYDAIDVAEYVSEPIKGVNPLNKDLFSEREKVLITSVVEKNYKKDVWYLVQETHKESPWKNNYKEGHNNEISIIDMEEYFCCLGDVYECGIQ